MRLVRFLSISGKNVQLTLKVLRLSSGSWRLSGNEFQVDRPAGRRGTVLTVVTNRWKLGDRPARWHHWTLQHSAVPPAIATCHCSVVCLSGCHTCASC